MSLWTLLILAALVCAIVVAAQSQSRLFPLIAVVVSGVEALLAFDVVSLAVRGLSLSLVLSVALLVAGAASWFKAASKLSITCAAVVTLVGAIQVIKQFI